MESVDQIRSHEHNDIVSEIRTKEKAIQSLRQNIRAQEEMQKREAQKSAQKYESLRIKHELVIAQEKNLWDHHERLSRLNGEWETIVAEISHMESQLLKPNWKTFFVMTDEMKRHNISLEEKIRAMNTRKQEIERNVQALKEQIAILQNEHNETRDAMQNIKDDIADIHANTIQIQEHIQTLQNQERATKEQVVFLSGRLPKKTSRETRDSEQQRQIWVMQVDDQMSASTTNQSWSRWPDTIGVHTQDRAQAHAGIQKESQVSTVSPDKAPETLIDLETDTKVPSEIVVLQESVEQAKRHQSALQNAHDAITQQTEKTQNELQRRAASLRRQLAELHQQFGKLTKQERQAMSQHIPTLGALLSLEVDTSGQVIHRNTTDTRIKNQLKNEEEVETMLNGLKIETISYLEDMLRQQLSSPLWHGPLLDVYQVYLDRTWWSINNRDMKTENILWTLWVPHAWTPDSQEIIADREFLAYLYDHPDQMIRVLPKSSQAMGLSTKKTASLLSWVHKSATSGISYNHSVRTYLSLQYSQRYVQREMRYADRELKYAYRRLSRAENAYQEQQVLLAIQDEMYGAKDPERSMMIFQYFDRELKAWRTIRDPRRILSSSGRSTHVYYRRKWWRTYMTTGGKSFALGLLPGYQWSPRKQARARAKVIRQMISMPFGKTILSWGDASLRRLESLYTQRYPGEPIGTHTEHLEESFFHLLYESTGMTEFDTGWDPWRAQSMRRRFSADMNEQRRMTKLLREKRMTSRWGALIFWASRSVSQKSSA